MYRDLVVQVNVSDFKVPVTWYQLRVIFSTLNTMHISLLCWQSKQLVNGRSEYYIFANTFTYWKWFVILFQIHLHIWNELLSNLYALRTERVLILHKTEQNYYIDIFDPERYRYWLTLEKNVKSGGFVTSKMIELISCFSKWEVLSYCRGRSMWLLLKKYFYSYRCKKK